LIVAVPVMSRMFMVAVPVTSKQDVVMQPPVAPVILMHGEVMQPTTARLPLIVSLPVTCKVVTVSLFASKLLIIAVPLTFRHGVLMHPVAPVILMHGEVIQPPTTRLPLIVSLPVTCNVVTVSLFASKLLIVAVPLTFKHGVVMQPPVVPVAPVILKHEA
jgi:hypothetical protein